MPAPVSRCHAIEMETHDEKRVENGAIHVEAVEEEPATMEEERRLVRKLDRRILPIICLLYLFSFIDRTNMGNARLIGLPEDVLGGDQTGKQFDWLISGFYFSFIICHVPATLSSKLFPPRTFIALAALGWGLVSTLMSTGFNFPGLMTARVMLGVFEAGYSPVMTLYLSFFYTKRELGLRVALWFGFSSVAGAFGGLIAFGIQNVHTSIQTWRFLFIVEGIPPVLLGVVTYFFLPNRPESTTYLTLRERHVAVQRMNRGTSSDNGVLLIKSHIRMAFRDWKLYLAGVIYFGLNCSLAAIGAFLPTIIATFGFRDALTQLLTVPPYIVSAVVLAFSSYFSDRVQNRGLVAAVSGIVGAMGYLVLILVPHNKHVRYLATFCITSGTYTGIGLMLAWFGHNLGSESKKAAGLPMFAAIGHCGSVLGSHLYPMTQEPRYIKGLAINCALLLIAAILPFMLSVWYRLENDRRDRLYGQPEPDQQVDTQKLADKAQDFRYVP